MTGSKCSMPPWSIPLNNTCCMNEPWRALTCLFNMRIRTWFYHQWSLSIFKNQPFHLTSIESSYLFLFLHHLNFELSRCFLLEGTGKRTVWSLCVILFARNIVITILPVLVKSPETFILRNDLDEFFFFT